MARIEKTVFISYRRTNLPWALAVYQNLTHRGYDVFFDYESINSGGFEKIIIGNIRARAHFIVILTPSALERCNNPDDWLRREIETALDEKRNIVPLFLEGFNFGDPSVAPYLTGKLSLLKNYNGLNVPVDYFDAAMEKLCQRFLNVSLEAVLHPLSSAVEKAVKVQKAAANKALKTQETATNQTVEVPQAVVKKAVKPPKGAANKALKLQAKTTNQAVKVPKVAANKTSKVKEKELTAQGWLEKGLKLGNNSAEEIHCYTEAIRLKPDFAFAYNNRAVAYKAHGDFDKAVQDFSEAIRYKPDFAEPYHGRGLVRYRKGDLDAAYKDFTESIRYKPDYAIAYNNRGLIREAKGDLNGAHQDYSEAIRLKPDYAMAYFNRGGIFLQREDWDRALEDYVKSIRFRSDQADGYKNRGIVWEKKANFPLAIADYKKYLELGGGKQNGDQDTIEKAIVRLQNSLKR
jgi:tetratricopeptide (TPR) repeat protein